MKLSIIIPAYNEEETIYQLVENVLRVDYGLDYEVVIVNDGSTDNTLKILSKLNDKKTKLISYKDSKGKGFAVKTGISNSSNELIMIQDADLEYNPQDIPRLIDHLLRNNADVVYGSRFMKYNLRIFGKGRTPFLVHYLGNKFINLLFSLLYFRGISDVETGYKLFRKKVLDNFNIESNGFDFEVEITSKFLKNGYKMHEVPISFKPRCYKEGKKITKIDGLKAVYYTLKYRFFD